MSSDNLNVNVNYSSATTSNDSLDRLAEVLEAR